MPPFRPLGPATPLVEATAGAAAAGLLAVASAVRGRRIFHPDGVGFEATLTVAGGEQGARLLDEPATHRAVLRLSRGVGLPEPSPDILGLAVRVLDAHGPGAHQDLLLASSGSGPVTRHGLAPARSFGHAGWSTLLPYRIGGRRVVFGARPASGTQGVDRLADLAGEAAAGTLRYMLLVAAVGGRWEEIGLLAADRALPPAEAEGLRFNPALCGGGIEPAGTLQALRRMSYAASQAARGAAPGR